MCPISREHHKKPKKERRAEEEGGEEIHTVFSVLRFFRKNINVYTELIVPERGWVILFELFANLLLMKVTLARFAQFVKSWKCVCKCKANNTVFDRLYREEAYAVNSIFQNTHRVLSASCENPVCVTQFLMRRKEKRWSENVKLGFVLQ